MLDKFAGKVSFGLVLKSIIMKFELFATLVLLLALSSHLLALVTELDYLSIYIDLEADVNVGCGFTIEH